uniref:Uncharacterized protein n=1 Tax=Romanomermis culicivorax TaxID=13658 RepID=A0A915I383_ROMCU
MIQNRVPPFLTELQMIKVNLAGFLQVMIPIVDCHSGKNRPAFDLFLLRKNHCPYNEEYSSVDRAAIRRATQSIQREAMELMKCVTVTSGEKSNVNSTKEEDEIYTVESTPDNRLRLIKYGPKTAGVPVKKSSVDKNDEEKEKMDDKEQQNENEQVKNLREKINTIRQKLKKRSSESSSPSSTKSGKCPTISNRGTDKLPTTKLEKKDSTKFYSDFGPNNYISTKFMRHEGCFMKLLRMCCFFLPREVIQSSNPRVVEMWTLM